MPKPSARGGKRPSSVSQMRDSVARTKRRHDEEAMAMAGPALESAHQNDFAPHQAPSVQLAMSARMKQIHTQLLAEVAAHRASPVAAGLLEEAARVISDERALLETTLREMHRWAGQSASAQLLAVSLNQPVLPPELPAVPKAMAPMFAPLDPPVIAGRDFSFRQPQ